jgi:hypothetical protein
MIAHDDKVFTALQLSPEVEKTASAVFFYAQIGRPIESPTLKQLTLRA